MLHSYSAAWKRTFRISLFALLLTLTLLSAQPIQPVYAAIYIVDNPTDELDGADGGTCTSALITDYDDNGGLLDDISLREAICAANANGSDDTIDFAAPMTVTLSIAGIGEDLNATGDLDIFSNIIFQNTSSGMVTINANSIDRVLEFHSGTSALNGGAGGSITITGGHNTADLGGGIRVNAGAALVLDTVIVDGNTADFPGGGIYVLGTISRIANSIISNNVTTTDLDHGGGLYVRNGGTVTLIENCYFYRNVANTSGAVMGDGGAIGVFGGTIGTITRTTFDSNRAAFLGGAIQIQAGSSIMSITHSTFTGNSGPNYGGAINVNGSIGTLSYNAFINNQASSSNGHGLHLGGGAITVTFNDNYFDNARNPNCRGTPAGIRNFDTDGSCGTNLPVAAGTQYNATLADNGCAIPLADGSCVPTHALIDTGIPAINLVNPTGGANCGVTDERDFIRDTICDIGPYEARPEINVQGAGGNNIADGDMIPNPADGTDFGTVDITTGSTATTFTIQNLGAYTLNLTGPSPYAIISGATTEFTVMPIPSNSITPGGSTTFLVTFDPTSTGVKNATITIANDDSDETLYNFAITGTGTDIYALAAAAVCNGDNLDVTITAGNAPFNITGTSGPGLPLNGVGTGTYTLTGPDTWTGVTVNETTGDTETSTLGDFTCPPPASGGGGGEIAAQVQALGCDITIDVEADREVVVPGDRVVWTVWIHNRGSNECQDVHTYGTMPGEFSITGITPSRGSLTWDGGPYYLIDLGTLAVNETATVTIDSLLQGGAAITLPEGSAAQSAGQQICLTGYLTDPVNDTDCVTLFPDALPATGGEPVGQLTLWVWLGAAGLLFGGLGRYVIRQRIA